MPRPTRTPWLTLLALLALSSKARAGVNVPDWVKQAAAQSIPHYSDETNAVVLVDQTEENVTGPGEYVEHYRRVVRILRPDGRNEGDFGVGLSREEKVQSVHAWTIDSSGHELELKDKDFLQGNPFRDELYSDVHYVHGTAPGCDAGAVVAFEYTVRRRDWLNQMDWAFQEDIPVRDAQFSVQLPQGWEYKTSWTGSADARPVQTGNSPLWEVRDVPGIEREPSMPSYRALLGRMELAYFSAGEPLVGSWASLGQWYGGLTAGRRTATPDIAEEARQLTAGKTDFDSKVRSLASFLQTQVRYVAIEIGIGGYQPHAAGDIFHARYGDCKDKATLLSSMLQEVGIGSDYVLINTEHGVVDPGVPSAVFDHAILAIEVPSGAGANYQSLITSKGGVRYLLFDPTDEYTPLGTLRADLQDTYALLVTDSGGELIHTPLLPPADNLLSRSGHFTLSAEGTLSGEVTETRTGDHAMRERAELLYANQQERVQRMERKLNQSLKGFTLESSNIEHLDQLQTNLVLDLKFAAPQYGQVRGTLMLVRPRVLGEKSFEVLGKPRHYAFVLGGTSEETDDYEIELPPGYVVDDVPEAVKADVGFASYQSKFEVLGSELHYSREYIVRDRRVTPDHVAQLRKFEGMIGADESAVVILRRTQ